jgi:DNA polymerase elongation subunit (family B)
MKILLLDIETSPHSAYVWGLFKQTINLAQIQETGRVLCASYKWLGEKHTHFVGEWEHGAVGMLDVLHRVMEDADVIITYNGNRFDLPTLNKEFLLFGFKPPATS